MLLGQEVPNQESHHSSAMFDNHVMSFIQMRVDLKTVAHNINTSASCLCGASSCLCNNCTNVFSPSAPADRKHMKRSLGLT